MKFLLIILLFPFSSFSQDVSGVWVGQMYNDTTRQNIHYELAINELDGKTDGYSHTTFIIDGIKNIGVKTVKIKMKDDRLSVVDEKIIYNNYTEPPAKGVKMFSDLILSENDSAEVLSGTWRTNATKYYRPLTGTLFLERKKKIKPKETIIVAKLIQLGLSDKLSFLSTEVASNNIVAINNKPVVTEKSISSDATTTTSEDLKKQQAEKAKEAKAKEELAKAEELKAQKAKEDSIIAANIKAQKVQEELAKAEQLKAQKAKEESITAANIKAQKVQEELAKAEQLKAQKAKEDSITAANIKAQKMQEELAKAEQLKAQKAKEDSITAANIKAKKVQEESAKAEQLKAQKAKEDSITASKIKAQKAKEELAKVEQQKAQKAKDDLAIAEQLKAQKVKEELVKVEQIKTQKAHEDLAKTEQLKGQKAKEDSILAAQIKAQKVREELAKAEQSKGQNLMPKAAADIENRKIETIRTVEISQDSLVFSLYDNGTVDGDTVSVLLNGKVIWPRVGLLERAKNKTIYLTPDMGDSISIIMYAENLGSIPPNTGLLVIREATKIYEIRFSGDLNKNAEIILVRKKKE